MNSLNKSNTIKRDNEDDSILPNNTCHDCKEGYALGRYIYCNINVKFNHVNSNFFCENFVAKSQKMIPIKFQQDMA